MKDEALKLALEALENCVATCFDQYAHEQVMSRPEHFVNQTITALRQAIQQAEEQAPWDAYDKAMAEQAQPVAWRAPNWGQGDDEWVYRDFGDPVLIADGKPSPNNEPLYTAPPPRKPWVGLTEDEQDELVYTKYYECTRMELAIAIEAKLKEKNT